MKNKILTVISTVMIFIPWTILIIRQNEWALKSPAAEITIGCYIAFMILSGIFSIVCYTKGNIKNKLMQISMVINCIYAFAGLIIGAWSIYSAMI